MFDFERPNIEVAEISEDRKYGKFVVEPLERGYGITLGNSLRRIMLLPLQGAFLPYLSVLPNLPPAIRGKFPEKNYALFLTRCSSKPGEN